MTMRGTASGIAALIACVPCLANAVPVDQLELDLVLKRIPNLARGAQLYETCAACHGNRGEGVSDGTVPAIAGQFFTVVAKQLVDFRSRVRRDSRMEHFTDSDHLAYSQYVADVAAYVSNLQAVSPNEGIQAAVPDQGGVLYARACERCHGVAGQGNGESLSPRVAGQHLEYLLRQFDVDATIRRPALQRAHGSLAGSLTSDEAGEIAGYLASIPIAEKQEED